uniref:Ethanolamine kinase n=1 Tax=Panagrolaimus sp. JU765 TaxID=591449 RepID=A0AC34RE93_9BILA
MVSNGTHALKEYKTVEIDLENDELIQKQTLSLIKDLRPNWKEDAIDFKTFTNGITNRVYRVSHKAQPEEHLVFRVYGKNTEKLIDRLRELETISRLEKLGIAAPLHAKFSNGIVCGYLEGETLDCTSVRNPHMIEKICEAMAKMHKIPLNENEEPFIFAKMRQFLNNLPKKYTCETKNLIFQKYFESNDLVEQFEHLRQILSELNTPVVFCHNDLLVNNILYDKNNDQINFIDYEYADANYQLFDIANHFCEYAGVDEPNYSLCPTKTEKFKFLEIYFSYFYDKKVDQSKIEQTLKILPFFEAAAHFFWAIWALVQSANSTIDFDYLKYAVIRHQMFAQIITKCKSVVG